jgi:antitoxin (DNA-binding transcriptional repressor) of toxin-antitoxin stability system
MVNLHGAKNHLSRAVDPVLVIEAVVIARAGKPLVRLVSLETQPPPRRVGFLRGKAVFTAHLKVDVQEEIEAMFDGAEAAGVHRSASVLQRDESLGGGDPVLPCP